MGIILKKGQNKSKIRGTWYIRYQNDGKIVEKNTGIKILGKPPASLSLDDTGDRDFERSRAKAEIFFEKFQKDRKNRGASQDLMAELIREKTGRVIEDVELGDLYDRWCKFSRLRPVSEVRSQSTKAAFERFIAYLKRKRDSHCYRYLYDVTPEIAISYINSLKSVLAVSTVRDHLSLLSGTFKKLLPNGVENPFANIKVGTGTADDAKFHRKPLTDDEVEKLYAQAKQSKDSYLYPITVCAANTGLRIGDVCLLRWEDVYDDHISVVTSKTGAEVNIPIFSDLKKILDSALLEKAEGAKYVFPDAAECYLHNHSGLIRRGKLLFARALFKGELPTSEVTEVIDGVPKAPLTEEEVLKAIDESKKFFEFKKVKAKDVYSRFIKGASYSKIEQATGIPKSQVCGYLKDIEDLIGERIRPGVRKDLTRVYLAKTRKSHKIGKNSVSVYGWHSLRATFCVKAYYRNVPEHLIIDVVGHKTFETTKKYYIKPDWQVFMKYWKDGSTSDSAPSIGMTKGYAAMLLKNTLTNEQISALRVLNLTPTASMDLPFYNREAS